MMEMRRGGLSSLSLGHYGNHDHNAGMLDCKLLGQTTTIVTESRSHQAVVAVVVCGKGYYCRNGRGNYRPFCPKRRPVFSYPRIG